MLANKLKTLLESALKDGLKTIDGFRKETKEKGFWWRLEHHSGYPKMSFTETGFPSFYLSDHEKVDFSKILTTDSTGEQIPSWKDYHISVTSSEELQKFYQIGKYAGGPAKHDNELWQRIFTYFFLEIHIFRIFQKLWDIINLVVVLRFIHFSTLILIFNIRSTRFSVHFSQGDRAKP